MSLTLRVVLIFFSVLSFILCVKKIRESKLKIDNSITWLLGSMLLIFMSVFTEIPMWISQKLGFVSPVNFVFLVIIAFLLIQSFIDNLHLTELNEKIKNLNHYIALKEHENDKIDKEW